MNRIVTTFKNRQSEISTIAVRVIENMENNPDFPDPPPALEQLKKAVPELDRALADAQGGGKLMTAIKDDKKAIVLDLLQELVDYVTTTSKGDRTMMLSSGFIVSSENGSGKQPPSIQNLIVELGPPGEVTIRAKNVTGAIAFVHQYTTEPPNINTKWIGEGCSHGSYTFTGLSSDKRYWFRVVAIGYGRQIAYSPVVTRVVQ